MKVTPSAFLALAGAVPAQYQFVVRDAEPVFGLDPAAISAGGLAAGDVDLPAAASLSGTSVFVNHHRQLASPGEPVPGGALTRAVRDEFR